MCVGVCRKAKERVIPCSMCDLPHYDDSIVGQARVSEGAVVHCLGAMTRRCWVAAAAAVQVT